MVHLPALFFALSSSSLVFSLSIPTGSVVSASDHVDVGKSPLPLEAALNSFSELGTCGGINNFPMPGDVVPPYTGRIKNAKNVKVITDSEVSALKGAAALSEFKVVRDSSGRDLILFDTSPEDTAQQKTAASFVHDDVRAGNPTVKVPVLSARASEETTFSVDVSFLKVFQLEGTISPEQKSISATLYVTIRVVGRATHIKLAGIQGQLTDGIEVKIDLALAKGSVKFSARPNASGNHDLYIDRIDLKVKSLKKVDSEDIKLLELPF